MNGEPLTNEKEKTGAEIWRAIHYTGPQRIEKEYGFTSETSFYPSSDVFSAVDGFRKEIHDELKGDEIESGGSMEEDEILEIHNKWFPVFKVDS